MFVWPLRLWLRLWLWLLWSDLLQRMALWLLRSRSILISLRGRGRTCLRGIGRDKRLGMIDWRIVMGSRQFLGGITLRSSTYRNSA